MKESNPIEVAKISATYGIYDKPAFVWWVSYTLRKRDKLFLLSMPG